MSDLHCRHISSSLDSGQSPPLGKCFGGDSYKVSHMISLRTWANSHQLLWPAEAS